MTLPEFDRTWTLFLDRDGVLNRKIENGYVLDCSMLEMLPGTPEAIERLGRTFGRIVIVTNQRGVARGLMSEADLKDVHDSLLRRMGPASRHISAIFACLHDISDHCNCRKPNTGLALQAQRRFADIAFERSLMVGDSDSDIQFGISLGMRVARIVNRPPSFEDHSVATFPSLAAFAACL